MPSCVRSPLRTRRSLRVLVTTQLSAWPVLPDSGTPGTALWGQALGSREGLAWGGHCEKLMAPSSYKTLSLIGEEMWEDGGPLAFGVEGKRQSELTASPGHGAPLAVQALTHPATARAHPPRKHEEDRDKADLRKQEVPRPGLRMPPQRAQPLPPSPQKVGPLRAQVHGGPWLARATQGQQAHVPLALLPGPTPPTPTSHTATSLLGTTGGAGQGCCTSLESQGRKGEGVTCPHLPGRGRWGGRRFPGAPDPHTPSH